MADKVLVLGATGNIGRSLIKNLKRFGIGVRAATRMPVPYAIAHPDLDVVLFDYDDPGTYEKTISGVQKAFVVTKLADPDPIKTVIPFIDRARDTGLSQIVLVSTMGVDQAWARKLHEVEEHLISSGLMYTILRPNWLMQNFSTGFILPMIQKTGTIFVPAGKGRTTFVDTRDVAAVATIALTEEGHLDRTYTLTGSEAMTYEDTAQLLTRVSGRSIRYVPSEEAAFRQSLLSAGWYGEQVEFIAQKYSWVASGEAARKTGDIQKVLGRPPIRFIDFALEHADLWRHVA